MRSFEETLAACYSAAPVMIIGHGDEQLGISGCELSEVCLAVVARIGDEHVDRAQDVDGVEVALRVFGSSSPRRSVPNTSSWFPAISENITLSGSV